MKYINIIKYFFSTWLILASITSAASAESNDYDSDYYNEGILLFKVRGYGIFSSATQTGLAAPTATPPASAKQFIANGYGGDTATTIFLSDHVSTELSLGFNVLNTKYSTLNNISYNYGGSGTTSKKKPVYMIPLTLTGQYQIAPFGAIRPYVGAGYHVAYLFTSAKEFKIKNGHGLVFQVGADFFAKDNTFINVDVRQYLLKAKVNYNPSLVNSASISSTAKINPLIISIGLGFAL